ncbi:GAF domain-containing protein [Pelomonas sp. P8]|uniref:GAF domain-containing protein n=1 Tax=Pelomonas cellulosilytica TaxID=2906762 RepID=A0ABS8XU69_9BURK|nr:GAF domain-containing protein [Pelomonas sp. P8]
MILVIPLAALLVIALVLLRRRGQDYRLAKIQAERLRNFLLALARSNRMVLCEQREEQLLQESCRICVETGHALLACVYVRDGDLAHRAAMAGPASRVLENVPSPLPLQDPDVQDSYTVRVLNKGVRLVSNDYVLDGQAGRWREEAVAQGIRAIAWIPLHRGGSVHAVLMLCAGERGFFDEELLKLLDELGADLSFALDSIDIRNEAELARLEVEAGHKRFRTLFDAAPVPMAIVSIPDRRIREANATLLRLSGLDKSQLLGTETASNAYAILPEDRDLFYRILSETGHVRDLVLRIRQPDGRVQRSVFNAEQINYSGQACFLVTSANVEFMHSGH